MGELFRTDASAHDDYAVLGGWECRDGTPPHLARWFSMKITAAHLPEFFSKGSAKKVVAGWELLATMVAARLFIPEGLSVGRCACTGATDNQGNAYIVARGLTTSFPLNIVMMQVVADLERRGAWLNLQWTRRDKNQEADDLTNMDYSKFDGARRICGEWRTADYDVMARLLPAGTMLYEEATACRHLCAPRCPHPLPVISMSSY